MKQKVISLHFLLLGLLLLVACGGSSESAAGPAELVNLFDDGRYADVRHSLVEQLLRWVLRVQDPLPWPSGYIQRKSHPHNYWSQAGK